ncbi:hypothetical protein B4096_1967 [Heyndrickxia coagulans]|nr:hypothetical protein B4100_2059 [Heyndrickxia coagulans]KYC84040.1 hypothetical protein B4096_1967 [Heyndrickxia coagulans]
MEEKKKTARKQHPRAVKIGNAAKQQRISCSDLHGIPPVGTFVAVIQMAWGVPIQ